jgi:hypothetical protein
MDTQEKTLVGLRTALESQAQMLRVLSAPRTVTASLAPQGGFSGSGRVLVDAQTGEAHVVLAGLPSPGPGKTYELWAIRGSNPPEPAGLVDVGTTPATAARVERIPVADRGRRVRAVDRARGRLEEPDRTHCTGRQGDVGLAR